MCLGLGSVFLVSPGVEAATLSVPSQFPTIAAALAAAIAGDTVLVSPGTYFERLTMKNGVILRGAAMANPPVVDAQGLGVAIRATNCGSSTQVKDMIFRNGFGIGFGGGAQIVASSLTFERCRFENNTAMHGGGAGGDGAFYLNACIFDGNHATDTGGAVACTDLPSPTIAACRMSSNTAISGGAIAVRNGCAPAITTAILDENIADQGSAIWWDFFTGGTFERCTVVENTALALDGGALACSPLSTPLVTRTIVAFNSAGGAATLAPGSSATFGCNDLFGNIGGNSIAGAIDLGTNLFLDPLFCNAAGEDYSLQGSSPCLLGGTCGLIGAVGAGPCLVVAADMPTQLLSWGSLKARYR
jgi:predicted outer membrane repeat protein